MAIGTAAAIGLGIAAASQTAGAVKQSRAAGRASKAQQAAAAESNRVAGGVYGDAMGMTQPYRRWGDPVCRLDRHST
jgi:hypothetical protein